MRVLLVGNLLERDRLRPQLVADHVDIAGEFPTLAAARESGLDADGILLAADRHQREGRTRAVDTTRTAGDRAAG